MNDIVLLNKLLIENFPNLLDLYNEEVNWQEGNETGSHTVYGDVFNPFFKECLSNGDNELLNQICFFINKLADYENEYFDEVISLTIFEGSIESEKEKELVLKKLNDNAKKLLK